MQKCLLIKTKDKRKFFTHEKNYPDLIEFSKTFGAKISIVKVENAEILDLKELAPAICDADYKTETKYEVVETKNCREIAKQVKKYILRRFQSGKVVSLKDLVKKYKKYGMSVSCLCNHLSMVRKTLNVEKLGGGEYRMKS